MSLAHKFAFENRLITAKALSAVAVPEMAHSYHVRGTPHVVLNDASVWTGRLSEQQLLALIGAAA